MCSSNSRGFQQELEQLTGLLCEFVESRDLSRLIVSYCDVKYKLAKVLNFQHHHGYGHLHCRVELVAVTNLNHLMAVLDVASVRIHWYHLQRNEKVYYWDNSVFAARCKSPRQIRLESLEDRAYLLVVDTTGSQVQLYNLSGDLVQTFGSVKDNGGLTSSALSVSSGLPAATTTTTARMMSPCDATLFGNPKALAVLDEFSMAVSVISNACNSNNRCINLPDSLHCWRFIGRVPFISNSDDDMLVMWDRDVSTVCIAKGATTRHPVVSTWSTQLASLENYSAVAAVDPYRRQLVVVIYQVKKSIPTRLLLSRIFCLEKGKLLREIHLFSEQSECAIDNNFILDFGVPRGLTVLNNKQDIAISFARRVVILNPRLC